MAKIRAGTLRHKIIIQRKLETADANGAIVDVWNNIKTTRASINPITGKEWFINESILNEVDSFMILRKTDLIPADRIIYQNREFNLVRVLDDMERGNSLLVLAKERLLEVSQVIINSGIGKNLLTESGDYILTESGINLTTEQ